MRINKEIDPQLASRLAILLDYPQRNPEKGAQGRAAFLAQAQKLAFSSVPAVTKTENQRLISWMHPIQQYFTRQKKEHSPMFGAIGTVLLIISLVLGGSGVTVAAAQTSLPDQPLYSIKTWSEDVRTGLTNTPQTRLELALNYANRRAEEMKLMLRAGEVPPDAVQARMQAEIDISLQLAAGQPDSAAVRSLEQIRQLLRKHVQEFSQAGLEANGQAGAYLDRIREMLKDRLQLCDKGIQDPDLLRQQLRDRERLQDGTGSKSTPASTGPGNPWTTGTPTPGSGYGPGPGDGTGGNPWTTGTPTPGSGYGPGPGNGGGGSNPWTEYTPTPGSSYGPGDGSGGNPWTENPPTPGSSYGPGPGDGSANPGGNGGGSDQGGGTNSGNPDTGGSPAPDNGGTDSGNGNKPDGAGSGGNH